MRSKLLITALACALLAAQLSGCAFARIREKRKQVEQAYAAGQLSAADYFYLNQSLDGEAANLRMAIAGGIATSARQYSANVSQNNFQFQTPTPYVPVKAHFQAPKVNYNVGPKTPLNIDASGTQYLVTPDRIGGNIQNGAIVTKVH